MCAIPTPRRRVKRQGRPLPLRTRLESLRPTERCHQGSRNRPTKRQRRAGGVATKRWSAVRPPYRRNVAIGIAPAITTPAIPLGGNAIASEELAGRVLSSRPGRSTAGSSRRSTILSHRPTAQQLTRAARAHSSGATDPRDATSEPTPLVDDPRRSRSRASRSDPLGPAASRVRHGDRQPRRGRPHQRHRPPSMGGTIRCPHLSG
jgi:hypothetical protein